MIQSPRASLQPLHAGGERADAGHEQPVGVHRRVVVAGDLDVGADVGEGALGGAHVAEAVVEDDDLLALAACSLSPRPSSRRIPASSAQRGADPEQHDDALGQLLLPEGDRRRRAGRARRR